MKPKKLNFFDRSLEYIGHSGASPPVRIKKFITVDDFVLLEPFISRALAISHKLDKSESKLFFLPEEILDWIDEGDLN